MGFDIDQALADMARAIAGVASNEWPDINACVEQALRDEKETLKMLGDAFASGDLSEEDLHSQLEDEKLALESALLACRVETKVMAQNAANAAITALAGAIRLAI